MKRVSLNHQERMRRVTYFTNTIFGKTRGENCEGAILKEPLRAVYHGAVLYGHCGLFEVWWIAAKVIESSRERGARCACIDIISRVLPLSRVRVHVTFHCDAMTASQK